MQNLYVKLAEFTTIETPNLMLRPPSMADVDDMYAYASRPENLEYIFPAHKSPEVTAMAIANFFMKAPLGKWFIEEKASHKMIGTIDFVKLDETDRFGEIGYALNMAYWGRGYMTEAVQHLSEVAFSGLGLKRLEIVADERNIGSRRVAEKSGFKLRKTYKAQNKYTKEIVNFTLYSRTKGELTGE
jgi:ribosomal-protein-alanine N-acetyltransferase